MCVCAYIGTHHSNPPPHNHQPTSWASYPWSLGVLCAHLEWLGWVLPFIAGLGATAHIPAAALSLSTQSRPAHFSTHYHLSRRFLVTWPWDHYPAINFQATFTSFHQTFIHNIDFCTHVHPTWSPPPTHATQHLWATNPPPPSTSIDFYLGFQHPTSHSLPPSPRATPMLTSCTHTCLIWTTNPPPPSIFIDFHLGFDHPLVAPTTYIPNPPCCVL